MNRTLATALAFAAGLALADDRAVSGTERHSSTQYESLDSNRDGYLSESEAKANPAINFGALDADKDGRLSMHELAGEQSGAAGPGGDIVEKPPASSPGVSSGENSSGGSSGRGQR
ncbi:MAG: hypothetical protein ACREV9_02010 [Burkholderiales bacterium]